MISVVLILTTLAAADAGDTTAAAVTPAIVGERLFHDIRFANPRGDMHTSCASCHLVADPQGERFFTEQLSRSWRPWRGDDPGRETLRNSQTLLDVAEAPLLHWDGEFTSLEQLARETLLGRNFGWLPLERNSAAEQVKHMLARDGEFGYRRDFSEAYGVDIETVSAHEAIEWAAKAIAEFIATLRFSYGAPFDEFVRVNGLRDAPAPSDSMETFAGKFLETISELEETGALVLPDEFGRDALTGLRIFFRTDPTAGAAGQCVTCHVPPRFTDFAFHNTGVSQLEYDSIHGEGSFFEVEVAEEEAENRPVVRLQKNASESEPRFADFGFWNYANVTASPLRRENESPQAFLERMIAAFKTPTLRQLRATDPYMHNGAFASLEDAITQKIRAADLAREGKLRSGSDMMGQITVTGEHVPPLVAFLLTLTDRDIQRVRPLPLTATTQESPNGYLRY